MQSLSETPTPESGNDAGAEGLPFGALFEHLPAACVIARLDDGTILAANQAWCTLTGIPREQAIGRTSVALGIWRDAREREDFLRGRHDPDRVYTLHVAGDGERPVRMRTQVFRAGGTDLLLNCFTEADAESLARSKLQLALNELASVNRELQARIELHDEIERLAQVGAWTNQEGSDVVQWSAGLYALTGRTPGTAMDKLRARGGIHPDDREAWLAHRHALDGSFMDFRWITPDGRQLWLRTRMSRSQVPGNPYTDFGVVQDVTAERAAREQLQAQLALLTQVAQHTPGLMYQARRLPDGRSEITFVSDTARELLQLAPHEATTDPRALFQRVHPDDLPRLLADLDASARARRVWRDRYRLRLPDGSERWYRFEATPDPQADGAVLWHGFMADVTEERAAHHALDRQQQLLQAVHAILSLYIGSDRKAGVFPRLLREIGRITRPSASFLVELQPLQPDAQRAEGSLLGEHGEEGPFLLDDAHAVNLLAQGRSAVLRAGHLLHDAVREQLDGEHPLVLVPLRGPKGLVGLVGLQHPAPETVIFELGFLEPLTTAAAQLLLAWQSARQQDRTLVALAETSRALEAQRRDLQITLQSIGQGLAKIESDGRVSFYNQRLLELLDLPDALLAAGPTHAEVSHFMAERGDFGDTYEFVEGAARAYVRSGGESDPPGVYLRKTRDGRFLEIGTHVLPEGGWVRTITDVSSYVRAQEDLARERQRLAWILEATRPGTWENNLQSDHLTVNERWAELVGYTLAELAPVTNQTWTQLVHPEDLARADAARDAHIAGRTPFYECDIRMRHKDGHWVWINTRGRVHRRASDGQPIYMSGTHLDISDRVRAQEALASINSDLERMVRERTRHLERTLRDMEAIAYSIAHDLRTPLRSVNGFASVLVEDERERLSAAGIDSLDRIVNATRRMGQMLTEMLDLLAVVRADLVEDEVDMQAMALEIDEELGLGSSGVALTIDELPLARGDHKLLKQALRNLMDNAAKYSRHRQPPQVQVGYDPSEGAYFVRDNGIGFDMAQAHKLFGLFQRLHADARVPGLGIGLAIASRVVERHGGRIWAQAAPGQGATFWMRLPPG